MSQSRPIVFLGLAIAIALVTSLLIYKKLQGAPVEPMEEGANVAVAARDIVWGTKLAPDMIKAAGAAIVGLRRNLLGHCPICPETIAPLICRGWGRRFSSKILKTTCSTCRASEGCFRAG